MHPQIGVQGPKFRVFKIQKRVVMEGTLNPKSETGAAALLRWRFLALRDQPRLPPFLSGPPCLVRWLTVGL